MPHLGMGRDDLKKCLTLWYIYYLCKLCTLMSQTEKCNENLRSCVSLGNEKMRQILILYPPKSEKDLVFKHFYLPLLFHMQILAKNHIDCLRDFTS